MAYMVNMAQDWSYDMFVEDAKAYDATAQKGVHRNFDEYRGYFMTTIKNQLRDFTNKWNEEHDGHQYDRYDGYIGDAFERVLRRTDFSDFYKEAYGQRPHLSMWYYVHALNLPHSEDVARTFCARPVENAIQNAIDARKFFEEEGY